MLARRANERMERTRSPVSSPAPSSGRWSTQVPNKPSFDDLESKVSKGIGDALDVGSFLV
jgi:hypothetical protein